MTFVQQRIIVAFLSRQEAMSQTQLLSALEGAPAKRDFWTKYKIAHAGLSSLRPFPSPLPGLSSLPAEARDYITGVEETDSFQENFGGVDYNFGLVPIERVTPIQIFCNTEPDSNVPRTNDLEGLLKYALPKDATLASEATVTPTGIRLSSPRYGLSLQNVRRRVRGNKVEVSFEHLNLVLIHKYPNLLLLLNGTHRCVELLRAGHSNVPAIVIDHQSPAEFAGPVGPGYWGQPVLFANPRPPNLGARPPTIPDFLSELSVECRVATSPSIVDINFGIPQQMPIPIGAGMGQPIQIQLGAIAPPGGP